jgi:hypothetical protein
MCCAIHSGTAVSCLGGCFQVQPAPVGEGFEVVLAGPNCLYSFVTRVDKKEIAESLVNVLNNVDALRLLDIVFAVIALRDRELRLLTCKFSDPYYDE